MSKNTNIDNFNGYFQFLNNDYSTWVLYQNQLYASVTLAFQAARTEDPLVRTKIANAQSYQQLAEIVKTIKNPADWNSRRYKLMQSLVRDKFRRNKQIKEKLIATENRHLINTYPKSGDNELYWGVFEGAGSNCLGRILQTVRNEIIKGTDLQKWINDFDLQKDMNLIPKISLRIQKNNQPISKLTLQKKNYFTFGNLKTNDFMFEHPSISRSHAIVFIDRNQNVYVVDLNSTSGTFINSEKIEGHVPRILKQNDEMVFGMSTRKCIVLIDTKNIETYLQRKQQEIKKQLKQIETLKKDGNSLSNEEIRSKIGFRINDCLLIQNLPENTSIRKLRELFEEYARIKDINLCIDPKTGKDVGIAIIHLFHEKEAQEIIIKRLKFQLNGKLLTVKLFDRFQANKILQSYTIDFQPKKKERSRSRSRDKKKKDRKH